MEDPSISQCKTVYVESIGCLMTDNDSKLAKTQELSTEVCRLVEGAKAEVYTVVIILAIVLVYTDSHNTMANIITAV
jgi:hypothetical protein